jgi:hypothetical protein
MGCLLSTLISQEKWRWMKSSKNYLLLKMKLSQTDLIMSNRRRQVIIKSFSRCPNTLRNTLLTLKSNPSQSCTPATRKGVERARKSATMHKWRTQAVWVSLLKMKLMCSQQTTTETMNVPVRSSLIIPTCPLREQL